MEVTFNIYTEPFSDVLGLSREFSSSLFLNCRKTKTEYASKMSEKKESPAGATSVDTERGADIVVAPEQNAFQRLLHQRNDLDALGKEMVQQALQYDRAQLEADAVKVRWKLDLFVLPMVRCLSSGISSLLVIWFGF